MELFHAERRGRPIAVSVHRLRLRAVVSSWFVLFRFLSNIKCAHHMSIFLRGHMLLSSRLRSKAHQSKSRGVNDTHTHTHTHTHTRTHSSYTLHRLECDSAFGHSNPAPNSVGFRIQFKLRKNRGPIIMHDIHIPVGNRIAALQVNLNNKQ